MLEPSTEYAWDWTCDLHAKCVLVHLCQLVSTQTFRVGSTDSESPAKAFDIPFHLRTFSSREQGLNWRLFVSPLGLFPILSPEQSRNVPETGRSGSEWFPTFCDGPCLQFPRFGANKALIPRRLLDCSPCRERSMQATCFSIPYRAMQGKLVDRLDDEAGPIDMQDL